MPVSFPPVGVADIIKGAAAHALAQELKQSAVLKSNGGRWAYATAYGSIYPAFCDRAFSTMLIRTIKATIICAMTVCSDG